MIFEPGCLHSLKPFDAPYTPVFSVCDNPVSDFYAPLLRPLLIQAQASLITNMKSLEWGQGSRRYLEYSPEKGVFFKQLYEEPCYGTARDSAFPAGPPGD